MTRTQTSAQTSQKSEAQKETGENRLLILPTGYFGFVGKKACKALGITSKTSKIRHAREVLHFASEDKAFSSPSFSMQECAQEGEDAWTHALNAGTHILLNKRGEEVSFQFDRITSNDTLLIVASYIETGQTTHDESLGEWIEQTFSPASVSSPTSHAPLQDNHEKVRTGFDIFSNLSNDLMVICTEEGTLKTVNDRFKTILGYTQDQCTKLSFMDIVHPEDRTQIRPILMNIAKGDIPHNETIDFEVRMISRQGKTYPMEWRLTLSDSQIYMVGQDLSNVKEHEQILINQQHYLAEAQAIGHMGHWTWHMDSHKIEWSDEIYRIFGTQREVFTPTIELINKYLHRRDIGRTMQAFQRALIEKRDYEMEFAIKRPSGEERFIRCQGRCKLDSEGDVISLFGIMQDITAQIEHEKELKNAKESVERAYAAKSQFLANMSHELRTPLNAIIGFSEMMQRQLLGPIGTEKYLDYINGIRESGEHLLDLISDILDMSRIEAGKYELSCEKVNISKTIQLCVHMIEGRTLENNVTITTHIDHDNISLTADRRALMQIILNLLSNAVKFSKENGDITITCTAQDKNVKIIVEDNGIGIPAMKLNSITNPFEQVSNQYTRDHDGSGLGLAITKELVTLHKGTLDIQSQVNVGTCVTIILPR